MNELTISSLDFLRELGVAGIDTAHIGWNPNTRKIGYSKISQASRKSYNMRFYYFDISEDNVIIQCPRGFTKFRGCKITDFDNLLTAISV